MAFIGQTSGIDVALPNARESVECDASVAVGDWVYLDQFGVAWPAIATGTVESNVVGIVEAKANSTTCTVRFSGRSLIQFTGLDPTKDYFLSSSVSGTMTEIGPITGSGYWLVPLGRPLTDQKFIVNIKTRIKRAAP